MYPAAVKYVEAASAAATSDVDNAAIKLERNINKAKTALDSISLTKMTGPQSTGVGEFFVEPFVCKVTYGASADAAGVPGVNVKISYKEMQRNGRMGIKSLVQQTDSDGMVRFDRPSPGFVGKDFINMRLDFG